MKRKHGKTREIKESFVDWAEGMEIAQADGAPAVLRNVVVLGPISRRADGTTRRQYPRSTLERAVGLFEGANVYLDHGPMPGQSRSMRDLVGAVRNPRLDDKDRIRGDVHLFESQESARLLSIARINPRSAGMSPWMAGRQRMRDRIEIVEEILKVKSSDFVTEPATTDGLFENQDERGGLMEWDKVTLGELKEHCPQLVEAIQGEADGASELKRVKDENARLVSEIAESKKGYRKTAVANMLEGIPEATRKTLAESIGDDMPLDKAKALVGAFRESAGDRNPKSTEKANLSESKEDNDKAATAEEVDAAFSG